MTNPKLRDELSEQLCEAVLSLGSVEECYQFFEDICTVSELKALSQRLEVARMGRLQAYLGALESEAGERA